MKESHSPLKKLLFERSIKAFNNIVCVLPVLYWWNIMNQLLVSMLRSVFICMMKFIDWSHWLFMWVKWKSAKSISASSVSVKYNKTSCSWFTKHYYQRRQILHAHNIYTYYGAILYLLDTCEDENLFELWHTSLTASV